MKLIKMTNTNILQEAIRKKDGKLSINESNKRMQKLQEKEMNKLKKIMDD